MTNKGRSILSLIFLFLLSLLSCGPEPASETGADFPNGHLLVDTEWVAEQPRRPRLFPPPTDGI